MRWRNLTRKVVPGVWLIGLPFLLVETNSRPGLTWLLMMLLANVNVLLLIVVCSILFTIEYS